MNKIVSTALVGTILALSQASAFAAVEQPVAVKQINLDMGMKKFDLSQIEFKKADAKPADKEVAGYWWNGMYYPTCGWVFNGFGNVYVCG